MVPIEPTLIERSGMIGSARDWCGTPTRVAAVNRVKEVTKRSPWWIVSGIFISCLCSSLQVDGRVTCGVCRLMKPRLLCPRSRAPVSHAQANQHCAKHSHRSGFGQVGCSEPPRDIREHALNG